MALRGEIAKFVKVKSRVIFIMEKQGESILTFTQLLKSRVRQEELGAPPNDTATTSYFDQVVVCARTQRGWGRGRVAVGQEQG